MWLYISKNNKIFYYLLSALLLAVILIWLSVFQFSPASIFRAGKQPELKVDFFDVGQGNAVFIEAPNKNQVLIDGGPGSQILNKLGSEMPFFDRNIDIVVLTHPDADHLNGLIDVLQKYDVGEVIDPCINDSTAAYQEWLRLIEEKKIKRLCAQAGQKIKLAENTEMDILYPLKSLVGMSFKNTNDSSIVAKLKNGENSIILTGDAEEKTEYQLINSGTDVRAQILQVGHHGSKSSTSEEFLKAINPETAIIQVGLKNRYGHPHQQTLDRLKNIGAKIFRTDLDGDIGFLCDASRCVKQ